MLIILNIVIVLFLLGMAAIWSTYGLFSALLNFVAVVAAGVIALALWEPMSYWLLGRMPAYAHGVGLLAPFIIALLLLRGLIDRLCRNNVHVPRLADQIGGGAVGLATGVLAMGLFLIGANYLPLARDAFGWEPYNIQNNKLVEGDEGNLWLGVHEWSGSFFSAISGGSMRPISGPPLAEARPDLAKRAIAYRLPEDTNQSRSAHPDNIEVTGLYAVSATEAGIRGLVDRATLLAFLAPGYELPESVDFGEDGSGLTRAIYQEFADRHEDPEKHGRPSEMLNVEQIRAVSTSEAYSFDNPTAPENFEKFVNSVSARVGAELVGKLEGVLNDNAVLVLVDTRWVSDKPGTYDSDSKLRLGVTQVGLQTRSENRGLEMVAPIGFSVQYSQKSKARTFTELASGQYFTAYSPFSEFSLGLAFIVPASAQPERLFVRELRFDLGDLPKAEGQEGPINKNIGAAALAMGAPLIDAAVQAEDDDGGRDIRVSQDAVKITGTDAVAELSEMLPSSFAGSSAGLEYDKDADPWRLKSGKKDNMIRGRGGQKSTIREVYVDESDRLVRIAVDNQKAQSLYGQARALAASLSVMQVLTESGNDYSAIGFAHLDANNRMTLDIRETGQGRGLSVKDLPNVRPDEELYVYFSVPVGQKVTAFLVADDRMAFEAPLEVVKDN